MVVLESANVVVIGHFNPFLISPEWLSKVKIWEPSEVQLALGALKQDSVRFQGDGVEWIKPSTARDEKPSTRGTKKI